MYERDGQLDFYNAFLPRIGSNLSIDDVLGDNNDGVLNGNLLEFKLNVTDLDTALFQCIKYLSALRIKGKPVPSNILIVSLNAATAWLYHSVNYLQYIEKVYYGAASKDNKKFSGGGIADKVFCYDKPAEAEELVKILKEKKFTKINIDENCVVGWATPYYKTVPTARKEDFIGDSKGKHKATGEIRQPNVFADYIYPYKGETNVKFNYLMDRLNDFIQKKNLGAFYTPELYAEKSLELVRMAIDRVPNDNNYIILDRCAGTGNLESHLTNEELSHCIVSTVEYYEYKVLQELFGDKVRHIIPPIETSETFNAGLVKGADALSEEYINNPIIKEYVENPKCTIILFENPPYTESQAVVGQAKSPWKNSYVVEQMKNEVDGTVSNDLGNVFIWSGFKYYLRQPTDSYVVYSPVKYWKAQHLVNKQFVKGFAFNRKYFHTKIDACIMCALWANIDDYKTTEFSLEGYNIEEESVCKHKYVLPIKKVLSLFSQAYYDKRPIRNVKNGITVGLNGLESPNKPRIRPIYSEDIVGYMIAQSSGFDNPDLNSSLVVTGCYRGNGFFLRKDNYLEKLPMFCASRYITYNREWTERGRIMKSADGAERHTQDVANGKLSQFLLKCLLFTCVEMQNHMRTLTGSDGRFYRNELCLDGTNGETIALRDIKSLSLNEKEQTILNQWDMILLYAKKCENYTPSLTYGVYQIYAELDTSHTDEMTGDTVWDNIELHTALARLKNLVKNYYNTEIVPTLFEYEYLK